MHIGKHHRQPHPFAQALRHHCTGSDIAVGQNDDQLFTAITHGKIAGAQSGAQYAGRSTQCGITEQVTVFIVETFEMVEIYHDQGQRPLACVGFVDQHR
ncbi:hypothetical protein D3C81_1869730 [compost metagenome]